jgi:hypothetical protein
MRRHGYREGERGPRVGGARGRSSSLRRPHLRLTGQRGCAARARAGARGAGRDRRREIADRRSQIADRRSQIAARSQAREARGEIVLVIEGAADEAGGAVGEADEAGGERVEALLRQLLGGGVPVSAAVRQVSEPRGAAAGMHGRGWLARAAPLGPLHCPAHCMCTRGAALALAGRGRRVAGQGALWGWVRATEGPHGDCLVRGRQGCGGAALSCEGLGRAWCAGGGAAGRAQEGRVRVGAEAGGGGRRRGRGAGTGRRDVTQGLLAKAGAVSCRDRGGGARLEARFCSAARRGSRPGRLTPSCHAAVD